ncbi:NB-ARC domain-containing protein [Catenulispora rubra]|uniref:NB-ARC domain-containing protein n=1 Tax=Catenulispora rubra TaxID=280293 RepID=UPI0018921BEE|nr:NB-ARC domain-containing protein [Catenulispora rubra]
MIEEITKASLEKFLIATGGALGKSAGEKVGRPAAAAFARAMVARLPKLRKMIKAKKDPIAEIARLMTQLTLADSDDAQSARLHRAMLTEYIETAIIGPEFQFRCTDANYPPEPTAFADRVEERAWIVEAACAGGDVAKLLHLAGMRSIGKSTMLLYWIRHHGTDFFEDGIYYLDLDRLNSDQPDPGEVARLLLAQVGLPSALIPPEPEVARKWWARLTQGRKICVIFDHVKDADEIATLIPQSANSTVIVAADTMIDDLLGADVKYREVRGFDADASRGYFQNAVAPHQLDSDAALRSVVDVCAGIPAVLMMVAGILNREPSTTMTDMNHRLARSGGAIDEFRSHRSGTMRVFDESYASLPADARKLYRALGLLPDQMSVFGDSWLAEVSGLPLERMRAARRELTGRYLIAKSWNETAGTDQPGDGTTLSANHMIRIHARELLEQKGEFSKARQQKAYVALRVWYAIMLQYADKATSRNKPFRVVKVALDADANPFARQQTALLWVGQHLDRVVMLINQAFIDGEDEVVVRMTEPLQTYLFNRRPGRVSVDVLRCAVISAQRLGNKRYEARMRCLLSRALREAELLDEAQAQVDAALEAVGNLSAPADNEEQRADKTLRASVDEFIGLVRLDKDDPEAALTCFERAYQQHVAIKNARGIVLMMQMKGRALVRSGRAAEAVTILGEALKRVSDLDDRLHGRLWIDMASARLGIDDKAGAFEAVDKAMPFLRAQQMSKDIEKAKKLRAPNQP